MKQNGTFTKQVVFRARNRGKIGLELSLNRLQQKFLLVPAVAEEFITIVEGPQVWLHRQQGLLEET